MIFQVDSKMPCYLPGLDATDTQSRAQAESLPYNPIVGVVIPARNRVRLLGRAVESVQAQTYERWRMVVVDDHSTDETHSLACGYAAREQRIKSLQLNGTYGAQAARNLGIRACFPEVHLLAFLDSDDAWQPGFLETVVTRTRDSGVPVVYTEGTMHYEDDAGEHPRTGVAQLEGYPYRALLSRPPGPIFSSLCVRRECLAAIGYLDEHLVAFQEWDTCLRLAKQAQFLLIPEPLYVWYRHAGTLSADRRRNADGYAQIVAKHKASMLREVGRAAVSAHYAKLAQLNRASGRHTLEVWYGLRAMAVAMPDGHLFPRVTWCIVANLLGLSRKALDPQIRVYG